MPKDKIATYNFNEDAAGLADFIVEQLAALQNDETFVRVTNERGYDATHAVLERDTLSDGSTVVNLRIEFEE
jgi:hypothetical protein